MKLNSIIGTREIKLTVVKKIFPFFQLPIHMQLKCINKEPALHISNMASSHMTLLQ